MATVRPIAAADDAVPAELRDVDHLVWRSAPAFAVWCRRHGLADDQADADTWATRFGRARDRWAVQNDITLGGTQHPDYSRLVALGIPWVGALARAQARAEADL